MVWARDLILVGLLAVAAGGPAEAAEIATRLAFRDAQHAERLIAAAASVGDRGELRRQSLQLSRVSARVPDDEEMELKILCGGAIAGLGVLASDLSEPTVPSRIVAAETSKREYLRLATQCEANLGLDAPSAPNLR